MQNSEDLTNKVDNGDFSGRSVLLIVSRDSVLVALVTDSLSLRSFLMSWGKSGF